MFETITSKITFGCLTILASILSLNYFQSLFYVNTIVLLLYTILVFFVSIWVSFVLLQKVLVRKDVYTIDSNFIIALLHQAIFRQKNWPEPTTPEPIGKRVDHFITDIERQFIRKWYTPYIGDNEDFLVESTKLLQTVVERYLQLSDKIDSDKIVHSVIVILGRHVKEYKKALKKGATDIETNYRYAHVASKDAKVFEQFMVQLSLHLLQHFIHWELYNSVASRSLSAIMARKLFAYGVCQASKPGILNATLYNCCKGTGYGSVTFSDEQFLEKEIVEVKPLDKVVEKDCEMVKVEDVEKNDEPVKVFEGKQSKKTKTWRNSTDLDCISLGHDILYLSDINEEDFPDMKKESSNMVKAAQCTTLMATNIVKDLQQTTTNVVKHKIGDLQDEAAGVVEGILDFGMAGIRKGLRLTGLQDNIMEARPRSESRQIPSTKQRLVKIPRVESSCEEVSFNLEIPSVDSSSIYEGDILLEKSPTDLIVPTMEIVLHSTDSPEYEDANDLAATTAKLRSLLAQKTESNTPVLTSPMSLIPTPQDVSGGSMEDLSEADGALPSLYKNWARTATGVFRNTLDTLKTALPGQQGVDVDGLGFTRPNFADLGVDDRHWVFTPDNQNEGFDGTLGKFLAERQVFCTVENAYEAIEAIKMPDLLTNPQSTNFDEEDLDEFDVQIPMTKALMDLACELLSDGVLVKEYMVKLVLLTSGLAVEQQLHKMGQHLIKLIECSIGNLPKFDMKDDSKLVLTLNEFIQEIYPKIASFDALIGKERLKNMLTLFVESLQSYKVNNDVNLQILEVLASEVIKASQHLSPTYA